MLVIEVRNYHDLATLISPGKYLDRDSVRFAHTILCTKQLQIEALATAAEMDIISVQSDPSLMCAMYLLKDMQLTEQMQVALSCVFLKTCNLFSANLCQNRQ